MNASDDSAATSVHSIFRFLGDSSSLREVFLSRKDREGTQRMLSESVTFSLCIHGKTIYSNGF